MQKKKVMKIINSSVALGVIGAGIGISTTSCNNGTNPDVVTPDVEAKIEHNTLKVGDPTSSATLIIKTIGNVQIEDVEVNFDEEILVIYSDDTVNNVRTIKFHLENSSEIEELNQHVRITHDDLFVEKVLTLSITRKDLGTYSLRSRIPKTTRLDVPGNNEAQLIVNSTNGSELNPSNLEVEIRKGTLIIKGDQG
jgi:hypothetical protein